MTIEPKQLTGWEPYFGKNVKIATVDDVLKEVRPTHGYFPPHKHGIAAKRWAKKYGNKIK